MRGGSETIEGFLEGEGAVTEEDEEERWQGKVGGHGESFRWYCDVVGIEDLMTLKDFFGFFFRMFGGG